MPVEVADSPGPGLTGVTLDLVGGERLTLTRTDGRMATLTLPGQPGRRVALARRSTTDLLDEELRRLDPDDIYAAAIRNLARTS